MAGGAGAANRALPLLLCAVCFAYLPLQLILLPSRVLQLSCVRPGAAVRVFMMNSAVLAAG